MPLARIGHAATEANCVIYFGCLMGRPGAVDVGATAAGLGASYAYAHMYIGVRAGAGTTHVAGRRTESQCLVGLSVRAYRSESGSTEIWNISRN